jgi:hypothetical protein
MLFKDKLTVVMEEDKYKEDGYKLQMYPEHLTFFSPSSGVEITTEEVEFEVNIPSKDELYKLAIATYKNNISKIWANAQSKVDEEEEKISKLLQLEHKV